MREFPRAMYRMPGVEKLDLGMFTTALAHDVDQCEAMLADGWFTNQEDAKAAFEKPEEKQEQTEREALEARATELGIEFRSNISDAKLAERIAAKESEA